MPLLKSRASRVVLETLAAQLADVLTEVRAIVERSGHLDGDSAIEAGDQGIEDYKRLRELVGVVDELRSVQRSVYTEIGDRGVLATLYREGHDQFRGVRTEPLPAAVAAVVAGRLRPCLAPRRRGGADGRGARRRRPGAPRRRPQPPLAARDDRV